MFVLERIRTHERKDRRKIKQEMKGNTIIRDKEALKQRTEENSKGMME